MNKRSALILMLFIVAHAFFPCNASGQLPDSTLLSKVLHQLDLKEDDIRQELLAQKILPYATTQSVIVIPKYVKDAAGKFDPGFYELDAWIIIANNVSGAIMNKYEEPRAWTLDAIMLLSTEIDTGLYILNNQIRAFGIRVSYRNGSQPNPYSRTDLSLFTPSNNTLLKILNNYTISSFSGEWDTQCAGKFESIESVLIVDKKNSRNNFYTLIDKTTITKTRAIEVQGECVDRITKRLTTKKLLFNGKEYK